MIQRIPAQNTDTPECPNCGSEHAIRIEDAMLPGDGYDVKESGVFRCGRCRNEYQFLKLEQQQVFAPNAQCPACGTYRTKISSVHPVLRYHTCLEPKCQKAFKTFRPQNERQSRRPGFN